MAFSKVDFPQPFGPTLPLAYMEADAVYDLGFAQRHMDIFYSKLQLIYLQSRNLFSAAYIGTPAHQAQQ